MTEQQKSLYFKEYNNQIHIIGRVGLSIGLVLILASPFAMGAVLGAMPDMKGFMIGLLKILPIYLPSCIVEFLIYAPMLGAGGSYLAFITGNLANLKIPCAVTAREIAKAEVGTPENEIISTLSIATSSLVTIVIIMLGVLLLVPLQPILSNPVLIPAFNNVVPALFGALGFKYLSKSIKLTAIPFVFMTALYILVPALISQSSIMIVPAGGIAIGVGWILYKKDILVL